MTTAHKPTWKPAVGMSEAKGYVPTRSYSAKDMPGYLDLKLRKTGQGTVQQLKNRDFKAELLKRQAELNNKKLEIQQQEKVVAQNPQLPDFIVNNPAKKIRKPGQKEEQHQDVQPVAQDNPFPQDEDSQSFVRSDNQKDLSDSDQDDQQQLLRQFERVKQQRQLQQRQKQQEKAKYSANNRQSQLLKGNPLLQGGFSLTKRWYEDTVFKNQAKRVDQKKSYVNDNIRSQFHRKFINKYVMR